MDFDVWDTEAPLDDDAMYTDDYDAYPGTFEDAGVDYEGYTALYERFQYAEAPLIFD